MNKLLLATTLLLSSTSVFAGDVNKKCEYIHEFSSDIMKYRQQGASIVKVMEMVNEVNSKLSPLVIEAYNEYHYPSPEYQQRAITKFANDQALKCYESPEEFPLLVKKGEDNK